MTIDDEGLRFESPLGTSLVPWSSITAVRSNKETVAFFRDRVLMGYIPSRRLRVAGGTGEASGRREVTNRACSLTRATVD